VGQLVVVWLSSNMLVSMNTTDCTLGIVSTCMGDCRQMGKPSQPPRSTQPFNLCGMVNDKW